MVASSRPSSPYQVIAQALVRLKADYAKIVSVYLITVIPSLLISILLVPLVKELGDGKFSINLLLSILPLGLLSIFIECWAHMAILETLKNKAKLFISYKNSLSLTIRYFLAVLLFILVFMLGLVFIIPSLFIIFAFTLLPATVYRNQKVLLSISELKKIILADPKKFLVTVTLFFSFVIIIHSANSLIETYTSAWLSFLPGIILLLSTTPFLVVFSDELYHYLKPQ